MACPVIPEWSGKELIYLHPVQAAQKFGYQIEYWKGTAEEKRYTRSSLARVPLQDGETASEQVEFSDAATATAAVKEVALKLGADLVGVTHVDQYYVYKGQNVPHKYAIVIAIAMDYGEIALAPGPETNAEVMRVYDAVSRVAVELAQHIRDLGYVARAHTLWREQLNMLPHAYAAGLGELGTHGSLINRDLGCSFRISVVTADLPLGEDKLRMEGIEEFCTACQMCVNYCPGDAISHQREEVRGVLKWVVDTEKCAPYWGSYHACGICLQVCPWNAKGVGGKYRNRFIQTIKSIDLQEMRARLKAGLQEPWSLIKRPVQAD